ncbi:unnamed protein product [Strongylus vulgaris]|uniref:dolichol kinase n=1 Tax=Strongylus vulgaris TaxID=40348 RepID=A0A3P7L9C4_STRVU|nr:unnamed protein product [Strongylus vulgaris]
MVFDYIDYIWHRRAQWPDTYILLAFWSLNVLASICFGVFVTFQGTSSTIHRKFFHVTSSLIFISGLFFDRDFIWLSGWLMFCIFIIIELDSGIFLPLFLSPNDKSPHLYHLAGVAAVGVGDSVAAIVGSTYGTTRWPRFVILQMLIHVRY